MKRREFITLLGGGAAAWPLAARAQRADRVRRVGALMPFDADDEEGRAFIAALRQTLQKFGWTDGRNVQIEPHWIGHDLERRNPYAVELVSQSPDVIFACFSAQLAALLRATHSIPIVFVGVSDPVGSGYVASFAHPGGNVTGFTFWEPSMGGKWLEVLKEAVPRLARVAMMMNPETATSRGAGILKAFEASAAALSVESVTSLVRSLNDIEAAFATLSREPDSGLVVAPDTFTQTHRELIIALAARHRLPAVYANRFFVTSGGLMSYGTDLIDTVRRAASYIDRILKGERPAELPIQSPTKFELVINLSTAKALGLEMPASLLAHADEVIE
jgi:putative tryptophan/tyrosine transport system substrate-binding protein